MMMIWNKISTNWPHFFSKLRQEYGELSEYDLLDCSGEKEEILMMFQRHYRCSYKEAEKRIVAIAAMWGYC